jgi:predicted Fe-Mo cluster-binding NifX family protein
LKVVFTTSGDTLDAPLDERFGRAPKFLLYDTDTDAYTVVDNTQNLNAPQGAGIQAAQTLSRIGADVLVTGFCGPKAFRTLQSAGITVMTGARGTVAQALEMYRAQKLTSLASANVEGHWV